MKRLPDWRARLVVYLSEVKGLRFKPGKHDCMMFAAGAIKAMTGVDLARGWRGKYATIRKGQALLEDRGYADHVAFLAAHLEECTPIMACVGDIATLPSDDGLAAVGVVQGEWVYCLGLSGVVLARLTDIQRAFRV